MASKSTNAKLVVPNSASSSTRTRPADPPFPTGTAEGFAQNTQNESKEQFFAKGASIEGAAGFSSGADGPGEGLQASSQPSPEALSKAVYSARRNRVWEESFPEYHSLLYAKFGSPTSVYGFDIIKCSESDMSGSPLPEPAEYFLVATRNQIFALRVMPNLEGGFNGEDEEVEETLRIRKLKIFQPANSEIIGLMVVPRASEYKGPLLLVTFHSAETSQRQTSKYFLNVYGNKTKSSTLSELAGDCQSIEFEFSPYKLFYSRMCITGHNHNMILVSGSDLKIHGYQEDQTTGYFQDVKAASPLAEVTGLPSIVLSIDVCYVQGRRLVALGTENGLVQLAVTPVHSHTESGCAGEDVEKASNTAIMSESAYMDGPVSCVKLFSTNANNEFESAADVHLFVGVAVGDALVFQQVMLEGLSAPVHLPGSRDHDSVMCVAVADLNWDGHNELVVGTYGHEILVYSDLGFPGDALGRTAESVNGDYQLVYQKRLPHPVYAIAVTDCTNDGMNEIIVTTMYGLTVLQADVDMAKRVILERLRALETSA